MNCERAAIRSTAGDGMSLHDHHVSLDGLPIALVPLIGRVLRR